MLSAALAADLGFPGSIENLEHIHWRETANANNTNRQRAVLVARMVAKTQTPGKGLGKGKVSAKGVGKGGMKRHRVINRECSLLPYSPLPTCSADRQELVAPLMILGLHGCSRSALSPLDTACSLNIAPTSVKQSRHTPFFWRP